MTRALDFDFYIIDTVSTGSSVAPEVVQSDRVPSELLLLSMLVHWCG